MILQMSESFQGVFYFFVGFACLSKVLVNSPKLEFLRGAYLDGGRSPVLITWRSSQMPHSLELTSTVTFAHQSAAVRMCGSYVSLATIWVLNQGPRY